MRFQGLTPTPQYRSSASGRLRPARPAALCLPDPCGLGSDSHGGKVFSGKLLEFLTQTGSKPLVDGSYMRKGVSSMESLLMELPNLQRMRAAKTASGARVDLVLFGDGARHGQDRRRGAGAPLSDPSRPLAGLEGV